MGKLCSSIFCTGWGGLLLGFGTCCASSWVGLGGFEVNSCCICYEGWLVPWGNGSGCCCSGGNGNTGCRGVG